MTKKGQVTIPVEVRKTLGLKPRDKVIFELQCQEARIRPVASGLLAGFGAVKPKEKPEDCKRLRKGVEERVSGETLKELRNG